MIALTSLHVYVFPLPLAYLLIRDKDILCVCVDSFSRKVRCPLPPFRQYENFRSSSFRFRSLHLYLCIPLWSLFICYNIFETNTRKTNELQWLKTLTEEMESKKEEILTLKNKLQGETTADAAQNSRGTTAWRCILVIIINFTASQANAVLLSKKSFWKVTTSVPLPTPAIHALVSDDVIFLNF